MSTPYQLSAVDYAEAGWSPIPLPHQDKYPPADGLTGRTGRYLSAADVRKMVGPRYRANAGNLSYPPSNVALRLPANVIGIDVDIYGEKRGATSLAEAETRWGDLPATWVTTSREPDEEGRLSGIRLYRLPEDCLELSWPGEVGKGIELIRWDHRFAIVAPSVHPEGREYMWWKPSEDSVEFAGQGLVEAIEEFPTVEDLAELPREWIAGLTGGKAWKDRPELEMTAEEVKAWIAARPRTGSKARPMCNAMEKTLTWYSRKVREAGDDGGAHEAARDGAWALIGDAASGHAGITVALSRLKKVFAIAVEGRREERQVRDEWTRIVSRGVGKVAAEREPDDEDICGMLSGRGGGSAEDDSDSAAVGKKRSPSSKSGLRASGNGADGRDGDSGGAGAVGGRGKRPIGSAAFDFTRDDIGNAQRLIARVGSEVRYSPGLGGWQLWDAVRRVWVRDDGGTELLSSAMAMVRDMEAEAAFIEDPKDRATFMKFVRASGNIGKLEAMVKAAKSLRGVSIPAENFDANPRLLNCPNGTLELREATDPVVTGKKGSGTPVPGLVEGSNGTVAFRESRPGDLLTLSTGTEFLGLPSGSGKAGGGKAGPGDWAKFLDRFVPDLEVRAWLQKVAGYSMLGDNPLRAFVIVMGETSSGKTTFAEVIRRVMGDYGKTFNASLMRDSQDERPRADIVRALPKRFIVAEEVSDEWRLHADQIKRITGGGAITARLPYAAVETERVPAFTPWLVTNNAPTINGADTALYRRLYVLPFNHTISEAEEDVNFRARMREDPAVRSEVLAWLVEGWVKYAQEGLRSEEAPMEALKAAAVFRSELSDWDHFLEEACEFGPPDDYAEQASDLYQAYRAWAEDSGAKPDTLHALGRALGKRGYVKVRRRAGGRGEDKKIWYRLGLRLTRAWAKRVGVERS